MIIGSGIAGSALAYELEKKRINYLICTDQKSYRRNTSSLSFGHCRVPKQENLEKIIKQSVLQLGEDEERIRFVYSRSGLVVELFQELEIDFEYRSFGIIPIGRKRGGRIILESLQKNIPSFETETELTDFSQDKNGFKIQLRKQNKIISTRTRYLVLATGGYAGTFVFNDNIQYTKYSIFELVRKNGGEVINLDCIFVHPFGYNQGRKIFIGNEIKNGEFIDSEGNFVFDREIRELVKTNNYHESFPLLVAQIESCKKRNSKVYFISNNKKFEITPTVHYTAGGIKTDPFGKVMGCKYLFAIGECKADGSRNGGRFPGYPFTSSIVNASFLADYFHKCLGEENEATN